MKKRLIVTLSAVLALLVFGRTVSAIPAFARKYGFNCNMCHVAFPKLNDWGQRFRDNGYQVPGQQGGEKSVFETGIPLSLRATTGYSYYSSEGASAAGFHLYGLDLMAAGVLHKNISFLFIYTPRIDEPAADFVGPAGGNNPAQLAALESASLVFSNIIRDKLNLRIGRFEPAYHLTSSKRSYYILQPYEIYNFAGALSGFDFAANPIGLEATGRFHPGLRYAVGYVNGSGGNPDVNKFNDVYAVLSKTFGAGEGQSAGQRIGIFGYLGWQPTNFAGTIVSPVGDTGGGDNKTFNRLGGELSLNWMTLNLRGMAFRGEDDRAFNLADPLRNYVFWGGAAELNWAGLADNRLVASALFNWVRPPSYDAVRRLDAYSGLVRYYLGSWSAVNIALHAEYTHRRRGSLLKVAEDLFTILLDFDF